MGERLTPRVDALLPVERDGWVQHRATYGHAASQMRACGKCMDALVAMRDALVREVVALRERAEDAGAEFGLALEAVAAERGRAKMAEARVALLEGLLREAFEILAALDMAVEWELAPSIKAEIGALVPKMLAALADGG